MTLLPFLAETAREAPPRPGWHCACPELDCFGLPILESDNQTPRGIAV